MHVTFAALVLGGLLFGTGDDPPARPDTRPETGNQCRAVPIDGDDESAQALVNAGWTVVGNSLYAPGCHR